MIREAATVYARNYWGEFQRLVKSTKGTAFYNPRAQWFIYVSGDVHAMDTAGNIICHDGKCGITHSGGTA